MYRFSEPYEKEVRVAIRLAQDAGKIALRYYGRRLRLHRKANKTLVTVADHACEKLIVRGIRRAFPHDRIVGEEHGHHYGRTKRFWAIDPIDGTGSFVAKTGQFCVGIALVENGRPVVGVIHAPTRGKTYIGVRGQGSNVIEGKRKRRLIMKSNVKTFRQATIGGQSSLHASTIGINPVWDHIHPKRTVPVYSALLRLISPTEGLTDASVLVFWGLNIWDMAAGEVIVREAGGCVTDCSGKPLRYRWGRWASPRGAVAALPTLHANIIRTLRRQRVPQVIAKMYRSSSR